MQLWLATTTRTTQHIGCSSGVSLLLRAAVLLLHLAQVGQLLRGEAITRRFSEQQPRARNFSALRMCPAPRCPFRLPAATKSAASDAACSR